MIQIIATALLTASLASATYSQINEVEGKVISFNDQTVTILQSGERVVIAKDTIQNPKEILMGKKVILKVKNNFSNKVEVPKDLQQTEQK